MKRRKRSYELRFVKLEEPFEFGHLAPIPTVCLLVADRVDPRYSYDNLIKGLLWIGCRNFMAWGEAAEKCEDILDEILVKLSLKNSDKSLLSISTTSHKDESAEDVAFFLLQTPIPHEPAIRCCVGFSDDGLPARMDALRSEISRIVGN